MDKTHNSVSLSPVKDSKFQPPGAFNFNPKA